MKANLPIVFLLFGTSLVAQTYNSLLRAESVRGYRGVVRALPVDSTIAILKRHGAVPR